MVYNLILTPYWHSSCDMALTIPGIVNLDIEYGCGPSPPISLLMLVVHRMEPDPPGIMTPVAYA